MSRCFFGNTYDVIAVIAVDYTHATTVMVPVRTANNVKVTHTYPSVIVESNKRGKDTRSRVFFRKLEDTIMTRSFQLCESKLKDEGGK